MKRFVIEKGDPLFIRGNAIRFIDDLDQNVSWSIEIKEYRKKRSIPQNAYIHAVPFKIISDHTGYSIDDIKEWLCGEFTGWEEYEVFGKKKVRPILSTSQMNSKQMTDFIEWMQWWAMSEHNLYIPSPNEWVQ
jgi:hypothetical protein